MRDVEVRRGPDARSLDAGTRGRRVGRPRHGLATRGRVGLLMAAAAGLAWLPVPEAPPEDRPMRRARGHPGAIALHAAFSPDGRAIATSDEQGRVTLRPVAPGASAGRRVDVPGFGRALAFSPDGKTLAIGRQEPDVLLCEPDRGDRLRPLGIPVRVA